MRYFVWNRQYCTGDISSCPRNVDAQYHRHCTTATGIQCLHGLKVQFMEAQRYVSMHYRP